MAQLLRPLPHLARWWLYSAAGLGGLGLIWQFLFFFFLMFLLYFPFGFGWFCAGFPGIFGSFSCCIVCLSFDRGKAVICLTISAGWMRGDTSARVVEIVQFLRARINKH